MHSFALALQFLTRIPIPFSIISSNKHLGQSVLYYPIVGLIIGGILMACAFFLKEIPISLQAAIILTVWVLLSGGLHLDGLADCADAWAGGLGNKQRTLDIMKDPAAGPIAVIILVLLLLLKWTAIHQILTTQAWRGLLISPLLGRTAILILMLTSPYIRKKGLGEKLIQNLPLLQAKAIVVATSLISIYWFGYLPVLLAGLVIIWIRFIAMQRLGGMTGDIYGAAVELVEMSVLIGFTLHE